MPMAHSFRFPHSTLQVLLCPVGIDLLVLFLPLLSDSSLLAGVRAVGEGAGPISLPKSEEEK